MTWLLAAVAFSWQDSKPAFAFQGRSYYHRFTKDDSSEFTPKGQEDLQRWTDLVTVVQYSKVPDGEGLAKAANAVLDAYRDAGAAVVRTDSRPRTKDRPAEHLIVVLFSRDGFMEAAFARFVLTGKTGRSVVYSHRVYGKEPGDSMAAWLQASGEKTEKALMALPLGKPPVSWNPPSGE